MRLSVELLSFLFLHRITQICSQPSIPVTLGYAILTAGCGEIDGCEESENGNRKCTMVNKFAVSSSNCIIYCYFEGDEVNQVNITFEELASISIDSFVRMEDGNILSFRSSVAQSMLNITITPGTVVEGISFYFISQDTTTAVSIPSSETMDPDTKFPATISTTADKSIAKTSDSPTSGENFTSIIIIVAVILGILLLLVACSVFALTFAVLFKTKKKHQSPLRIHSLPPNTPNMYEASTSSIGDGFRKMDKGRLSLDRPKPPPDPEYATVSEWKQKAGMAEKPVHNPFYDSTFSLEAQKGMAAVQVPQLEWSGSAWDNSIPPCSDMPLRIKKQLSKTDSMQDVHHSGKFDPYEGSCANPKYVVTNSIKLKSQGDLAPMPITNGISDSSASSYSSSPTSKNYRQISSPAPTSSPPPPPPSGGSSRTRPSLPSKNSKKITLNRTGSSSASSRNQAEQGIKMAAGSIPNGTSDPSPLVHNNHRAIKKTQSNEIINSEYAVAGIKHHH